MDVVGAVGADFDPAEIRGPHRGGAVIGFQHQGAVINVAEAEHPQFASAMCGVHRPRICAVVSVNIQFVHSLDLEDALRRGTPGK